MCVCVKNTVVIMTENLVLITIRYLPVKFYPHALPLSTIVATQMCLPVVSFIWLDEYSKKVYVYTDYTIHCMMLSGRWKAHELSDWSTRSISATLKNDTTADIKYVISIETQNMHLFIFHSDIHNLQVILCEIIMLYMLRCWRIYILFKYLLYLISRLSISSILDMWLLIQMQKILSWGNTLPQPWMRRLTLHLTKVVSSLFLQFHCCNVLMIDIDLMIFLIYLNFCSFN